MFRNLGNNARSSAPLPPGARVERRGFFRNFFNSIAGMFIGLFLVFGMCWLLFWNEVRPNPADAARMATELTSANAPRLQEQAVWVRGALSGAAVDLDEFLAPGLDREFIFLSRSVERWVWVEEEIRTERNRVGGGTETIITYEYHLRWSATTPNSALFRGHNPPLNPPERPGFTGFTRVTDDLSIAGFNLTGRHLSFAGAQRHFVPTAATIADGLFFSGNHLFEYQRAINAPEVGDYRISYLYVENNTNGIVLGMLAGNAVMPLTFQSTGLIRTTSTIYRFFDLPTIGQVIVLLDEEHRMMTWMLRFLGFFLMMTGFTMLFGPIQAIAGIIPFIKKVTGFIIGIVVIVLSLVLSLLVIMVANILNSVIALLVVLALVGGLIGYGFHRRRRAAAAAA